MGDLELRNENQRDCQRRVHVQKRALLMRFPISSCCSRSHFVRVFVLLSFILCILSMQPSLSFSHSIILFFFLFFSLLFFLTFSTRSRLTRSLFSIFFFRSRAHGFSPFNHSLACSLHSPNRLTRSLAPLTQSFHSLITQVARSFHFAHTASLLRSLRTLRSTGCWTARPSRTSRLLCATRS
jgi:hypothetical protein